MDAAAERTLVFKFNGELEISKSWMNRALIIQSYFPDLEIVGSSSAQDVILLKKALGDFLNGKSFFDVGHGGTTFRFLALRISRKPGQYLIQVSQTLRQRPSQELIDLLSQLSVQSKWTADGFLILSEGWKLPPEPLTVSVTDSSQFLSAFALNTIDLDFDIQLQNLPQNFKSQSYFKMTENLLTKCGIHWGKRNQKVSLQKLIGEVDISSAFSLASAAVFSGEAKIHQFVTDSLQPDLKFLDFFKQMGIQYQLEDQTLNIQQQAHYQCLQADLSDCPDLFPVLSVVCAFAEGTSQLMNAPHLKFKESDRIAKTAELLSRCGFQVEIKSDGIVIQGQPQLIYKHKDFILFDTAHDHRMAMAAALLILKGFPIRMSDSSVIQKSYPNFYKHIGLDDL
jgi:3-phosphoshikimate 1-carboxyvinyltransferase